MINENRYLELLKEIVVFLRCYGDDLWADKLNSWLAETSGLVYRFRKKAHIERTRKAIVGNMGSLTDLVICKQNGHNISAEKAEIKEVNKNLQQLVGELYKVIVDDGN
jgi:hypothetical protein